jgi:hypothetical protein
MSLVEVVLSLAMVGMILGSGLALQYNVFRRVVQNSSNFSRLFIIKNLFSSLSQDQLVDKELQPRYKSQSEDPIVSVVLEKKPVSKVGVFGRFKDLFRKTSTGEWQSWSGNTEESIVSFQFIPEKKDPEQEGEKK